MDGKRNHRKYERSVRRLAGKSQIAYLVAGSINLDRGQSGRAYESIYIESPVENLA